MGALDPKPVKSVPKGMQFAVIDVETTGLDRQLDRVVEIAVVLLDWSGAPIYEWTSLVNPGIDTAGPTRIHEITDDMAAVAPPFRELAADLAYLLAGRIIVAHNIEFDSTFIEQAFHYADMPVGHGGFVCTCTMEIAERMGLPRRLGDLCAHLGIFYDPHSALDDARVTSQVFARMLPYLHAQMFQRVTNPAIFNAVTVPRGATVLTRAQAVELLTPRDLVAQAAFRFVPGDAPEPAVRAYRTFVHETLGGRTFTSERGTTVIEQAIRLGLSAQQARDAHHDVLCDLFDTALEDNKVSKAERAALENTAAWLGVSVGDFDAWVKAARVRRKEMQKEFRESVHGQAIVITGKGVHPANIRDALALKHGFTLTNRFRPDAFIVVTGTDTVTTAAVTEARAAGVEVMTETTFWRRMGEL